MIRFSKTIFPIVLILFLSVESSNAYTDIDVKLFNAAQKGNIEEITVLLGQGADINIRLGVDQWTPLMTASREGKLETVEFLLAEGADPNIRDNRFNKNAYHWALQYGHRDVARLLLENGASRELKKPSQFFSRGMSMVAFLILAILIVSIWVLYFLTVVPFLKSNGIFHELAFPRGIGRLCSATAGPSKVFGDLPCPEIFLLLHLYRCNFFHHQRFQDLPGRSGEKPI